MTTSNRNVQSQIEGMATLLVLDDETRKLTTLREFSFFTTNETHRLIPYHISWLWKKDYTGIHLLMQSGTAEIDQTAPINRWLKDKIHSLCLSDRANEIFQDVLSPDDITAEKEKTPSEVTADNLWREALPNHFLWCPLFDKSQDLSGGLLFFREKPFSEAEIKMLQWLIGSYQYTWVILTKRKMKPILQELRGRKLWLVMGISIIVIALLPIRLSVLANATVVPQDPVLINAPMQGVIKSFAVSPGEQVSPNQLLLTLDKTDLEANQKISLKEYQLTESRLRTAISQGLTRTGSGNSRENQSDIPILEAQLEIDRAHLDYTKAQLAKAEVRSPISGIVVFDSKEDWIGQPVQTGERILIIANSEHVKLRILLPVANAITLKQDTEGSFFPYGHLKSIPFRIKTLGYNARMTPEKILAYQLEATFIKTDNIPQLGAKGTARIYGSRVPLIYYLFRRPLQALRQTMGF